MISLPKRKKGSDCECPRPVFNTDDCNLVEMKDLEDFGWPTLSASDNSAGSALLAKHNPSQQQAVCSDLCCIGKSIVPVFGLKSFLVLALSQSFRPSVQSRVVCQLSVSQMLWQDFLLNYEI